MPGAALQDDLGGIKLADDLDLEIGSAIPIGVALQDPFSREAQLTGAAGEGGIQILLVDPPEILVSTNRPVRVDPVQVDHVPTALKVHDIAALPGHAVLYVVEVVDVVAALALQDIPAAATIQHVIVRAAIQEVTALLAKEKVISFFGTDRIVSTSGPDPVSAPSAFEIVVPGSTAQEVKPPFRIEDVVTLVAE